MFYSGRKILLYVDFFNAIKHHLRGHDIGLRIILYWLIAPSNFLSFLRIFLFSKILYILKHSLLFDASLVENKYCPAVSNGGNSMRNGDGGQ